MKIEYMFDIIKTQQPILNKEVIAVSFFETEKEWVNEELNNERQTVIPAIASFLPEVLCCQSMCGWEILN